MIELLQYETGRKIFFPEELSECDPHVYIKISRFIYLFMNGKINEDQYLRLSVYAILNIEPSKKPLAPETEKAVLEKVAMLSDYVLNFFEMVKDDSGKVVSVDIKLGFTHNPIPFFHNNGIKLKGVEDGFKNAPFGQYFTAIEHFLDYEAYREKESLIKLVQTLYQPKYPFLTRRFIDWKRMDIGILFGVHLWLKSFQRWLQTATVYYGGSEINLGIIFKSDGGIESDLPGLGMKSILFSISESGVFGSAENVMKVPFWDVIFRMYDARKKAEDEKAQYEKLKNKSK